MPQTACPRRESKNSNLENLDCGAMIWLNDTNRFRVHARAAESAFAMVLARFIHQWALVNNDGTMTHHFPTDHSRVAFIEPRKIFFHKNYSLSPIGKPKRFSNFQSMYFYFFWMICFCDHIFIKWILTCSFIIESLSDSGTIQIRSVCKENTMTSSQ